MKPIPTHLTSATTIKMNEEECQTQARCSAKQQSDRSEQTPSEMVSQPEARMKARQAPMTSFTIKQSLEEQRTFINLHAAQAKKLRERANNQKDMSSSSQSPEKKNQEEPRRSSKTKEPPEDPTEAGRLGGHQHGPHHVGHGKPCGVHRYLNFFLYEIC